jgi:hypothetical protein
LGLWLSSCSLVFEERSVCLIGVLLPPLISKVQKISSPALETRTGFSWLRVLFVLPSGRNEHFCPWHLSCIVLSFQAAHVVFIQIRTQYILRGCGLCACVLLFETRNVGLGALLL